jgi:phosphatidylserine decarboxylase
MLTVGVIGFMQSVLISIAGLLICFFRDPERNPPKDRNSILSPADGEIVYIKKINKDEFPFAIKKRNHIPLSELTRNDFISCGGYQVGIGMNFLNVHVNRSPITGQVMQLNKIRGKFESLRKIKSLLENERVSTVIQGDKMSVCVVQIASRLVRRIISYIDTGHLVKSGQRIGMICFGSQVDVLIPNGKDLKILVKEKDEVKAGLSIIAKY